MRSKGLQGTVQTYNLLLSALTDSFKLNLEDKSEGNQAWNRGVQLLKCMNAGPVAMPDTGTFNLMLRLASVNYSAIELSGRVMREMFHIGVKPSLTTFYWLTRIHAVRGPVYVLNEVVEYLEKNPQTVRIQDTMCYLFFEEAMTACLKKKDAPLATRLLALVEDSGNYGIVSNLNFFVGAYLRVLTYHPEHADILISQYKRLVPLRALPFEWLYRILFDFCSKVGDTEFAIKLWEDMQQYNVTIEEVATVNRFCKAIGEAVIAAEQAEKLISMVERGVEILRNRNLKPSSLMINTLIRLACVTKDTDKMWEYYKMFEKMDTKPGYISLFLMLKAHYGSPDTEPIMKIMKEMISRDMTLDPQFLKDICAESNISDDTYHKLKEQFEENLRKKRMNPSAADQGRMDGMV